MMTALWDRNYDTMSFIVSKAESSFDIEIVVHKRWWANPNNHLPLASTSTRGDWDIQRSVSLKVIPKSFVFFTEVIIADHAQVLTVVTMSTKGS